MSNQYITDNLRAVFKEPEVEVQISVSLTSNSMSNREIFLKHVRYDVRPNNSAAHVCYVKHIGCNSRPYVGLRTGGLSVQS